MSSEYRDGQPCEHQDCMVNQSEPCEECGRIAGRENQFQELYGLHFYKIKEVMKSDVNPDNLRLLSLALEQTKQEVDNAFYVAGVKRI